jgi:signal transduction histidine kinase
VPRSRSVLSRIIALHVAAIVVTSACVPLVLFLMLQSAAQQLHQRALQAQAAQILRYLAAAPDKTIRLLLPPNLALFYSDAYGRADFAVLDGEGRTLFSSLPGNRPIAPVPGVPDRIEFFRQQRHGDEFYGATVPANLAGRAVMVQVAEDLANRDVLIDDIVDQFLVRVGWITVPFLLLLLGIDVLIFRSAMQPIVAASKRAAQIGPATSGLRLPEAELPREVLPLVQAVNQALDRLDAGFRSQREFTADAAHELRTPLAILSMQIDTIDDRELAGALRNDIDGMTRLVNQLLEFAELETLTVGDGESAELGAVAGDVVAGVAPLAFAMSGAKTLALAGTARPVWVHGERDALARALRNLVENALAHTAAGTTVEIAVDQTGALHVMDRGPGVPPEQRERIFRRFWRRDRRCPGHAGLGLAIVARIAEMHRATITVSDRPDGGAVFSFRFPEVLVPQTGSAKEPERVA